MSEIYDYMNDIVNGFRPMRRSNPPQGQSKWYYVDPHNQENYTSLSEMPTIDIAGPNEPNPLLQPKQPSVASDSASFATSPIPLAQEFTPINQIQTPYNPNLRGYVQEDTPSNQPTPISDEELFRRMTDNLLREEGSEYQLYLDTKGNRTIGIGANVNNWNDFQKVNWLLNNQPATPEDIVTEFNRFQKLINDKDYGQKRSAKYYKENFSKLSISPDEIKRLLQSHLQDDLHYLRREFPGYDTFPTELREVLFDIKFNTGNVSPQKWPKLHNAIKRRDLDDILANVHRKDVAKRRNQWAEEQINEIIKRGGW